MVFVHQQTSLGCPAVVVSRFPPDLPRKSFTARSAWYRPIGAETTWKDPGWEVIDAYLFWYVWRSVDRKVMGENHTHAHINHTWSYMYEHKHIYIYTLICTSIRTHTCTCTYVFMTHKWLRTKQKVYMQAQNMFGKNTMYVYINVTCMHMEQLNWYVGILYCICIHIYI